jgi:hypothetical protein
MSQIRIANKQDEPHIRALMKDALAGISKEFDLDGGDADLKNIEWSYFGHDGVFFVLEVERVVAGIAGAAKLSDDALEIKRLYVKPDSGLERDFERLLDMLLDFARKMDYRIIECASSASQFAPPGLLERKNFQNQDGRRVASL